MGPRPELTLSGGISGLVLVADDDPLVRTAITRVLSRDGAEIVTASDGAEALRRYATLLVSDTGTGMDAATQARIFEPFFTTKPLGQGTGLGLAAAQGVLAQNNGYITVKSAPRMGATFTVYLPLLQDSDLVERRRDPIRATTTVPAPGATILVVDDEPAVLAIAARILERRGYHVLQVPDGADALALVDRQGPPELLLTDLTMPGIGGGELARHMKARWPALPIIFMSGYSAEEVQRQGSRLEGELIQKPFTADTLVARVGAALSPRDARAPAID